MISKELLSEVLENEVPYQVRVHKIIIKNNSLNYFYNSKDNRGGLFEANEYINIYELAHKCKEWAIEYSGWTLQSYTNERDSGIRRVKVGDGQEINKFIAPSEVEAIFNASEWVYTELKNKGKINEDM